MDPAEDYLSEASQAEHQSSTGDALKNGAYGVSGWFVKNTSLLARERFRRLKDNVRTLVPKWDEKFTLLMLSESVLEPSGHMPGVKAHEIAFNTILRVNPELELNRPRKLTEKSMGVRLVGYGVDRDQDAFIRRKLKAQSNGSYDEPTVVGGRYGASGGTKA